MIYTEDSISEVTRSAIRLACEDEVMKIERHKRLFNIWMWVLVFVMVLTSSVLSIVGREVGLMWGWPFLIMVIIMNSNRQYEHRLDVMKISMNTEIIGKIKNSRA